MKRLKNVEQKEKIAKLVDEICERTKYTLSLSVIFNWLICKASDELWKYVFCDFELGAFFPFWTKLLISILIPNSNSEHMNTPDHILPTNRTFVQLFSARSAGRHMTTF